MTADVVHVDVSFEATPSNICLFLHGRGGNILNIFPSKS